jgi:hypothetical protein
VEVDMTVVSWVSPNSTLKSLLALTLTTLYAESGSPGLSGR